MRANAHRKGGYFLDLFAGKGGVSRAVQRLGFVCYMWEIAAGDEFDLTSPENLRKLRRAILSGVVLGVMLAPPCTNFSIARDRTMVVRTRHRGDYQTCP